MGKIRIFESPKGTIDAEYFWNGVSLFQSYWVWSEDLQQFFYFRDFHTALFFFRRVAFAISMMKTFTDEVTHLVKLLAKEFSKCAEQVNKLRSGLYLTSQPHLEFISPPVEKYHMKSFKNEFDKEVARIIHS